jgi:hypothetical protein
MTYTTLVDEIASQLGDTSQASKDKIFIFIKDICRFLSNTKARFNEATDSQTLAAGAYTMALPTGFVKWTRPNTWMRVVKDGVPYPITKQNEDEFFADFDTADTGMPAFYRIFANTITFKPIADIDYTITREYISDITEPTLAGTVAIPLRYLQIIKSKVLVLANTYQEDENKTNVFSSLYNEVVTQLKSDIFIETYPDEIKSVE